MATQSQPKTEQDQIPSAFDLIKPSYAAFQRNVTTFTLLILVPTALTGISLLVPRPTYGYGMNPGDPFSGLAGALYFLGVVLSILTAGGRILAVFRSLENKDADPWQTLVAGMRYLLRLIGVGICVAVILAVSFLLFIVPFFFMLPRYALAPYYVVDKDLGVMDALKESARQSKQYRSAIWGLIGVEILAIIPLAVLNAFAPILGWIGLIIITIFLTCAPTIRYRQIQNAEKAHKA